MTAPKAKAPESLTRRQVLQAGAAGAVTALGIPPHLLAQSCMARPGTVRDRLWLFTVAANADYPSVGRRSLMTPAEGGYYLGVPNVIIVQDPPNWKWRFEPPFDQYALALRPFERVLWSMVGSGGYTTREYRGQVLELFKGKSNLVGVYLDDFFFTDDRHTKEGKRAALTLDELKEMHNQVQGIGRPLGIWVTFYTRMLDLPLADYLSMIDVITMWTSRNRDLVDLEANLAKLDKLAPGKRKTLGCYFFDFEEKKPVPVSVMQYQCETGLRLLHRGQIEGIVFLANTQMDLGFECVDWTRDWITTVGDTAI